ncbi:MAG: hypothetical protein LQ350_001883 [Teloschistes chrysophthalmus]|nr:MAG: hypothetical protein LQ350_001883 [Niorma chrysophthalma]
MLKSTYKPAAAPSPLPAGWTEHKAPTGHPYYYNASTQQSTYTRPKEEFSQPSPHPQLIGPYHDFSGSSLGVYHHGSTGLTASNSIEQSKDRNTHTRGGFRGYESRNRAQPKDRPKSKVAVPGCEPWALVTTKLGRRFVYNPDRNESFWKFPPEVMKAVVEYDRVEREKKARIDSGKPEEAASITTEQTDVRPGPEPLTRRNHQEARADESEEYEEVEVTDEEDEGNEAKRQKTEDDEVNQPVEFNEDDIAYQLAAMGHDYGLEPGEYGDPEDEDLEEGAEGLPLSEEDASALFKDMLDDHHINPYKPWENLIEEGRIIEDDRYTVLANMKTRKEVWGEWSRDRIQRLKEKREQEAKKDPRIPYLVFLQDKATPKLYWPEFRRKYMKEPEMRNTKLTDKEREKWYRDYINRLKLPESTLKADLISLLKSTPLHTLHRSTSMAALPPSLLTDIRFISVRPSIRDPLIETHISTLQEAPQNSEADPEEEEARSREKQDRERRKALAERQMQVQKEKRRAREALEYSKGVMREGEQEVQRAMQVGRESLMAYMENDGQPPLPPASEKP